MSYNSQIVKIGGKSCKQILFFIVLTPDYLFVSSTPLGIVSYPLSEPSSISYITLSSSICVQHLETPRQPLTSQVSYLFLGFW